MIKILFLMNGAKPPRGGEFLTLYLIKHLRRDIFSPTLVYAHEGIVVQELLRDGINAIKLPMSNEITNIYPREIKLYNPLFIFKFIWYLFISGSLIRLNRLIKEDDYRLIYCADNLSKLIGGIVGKMARIKVVAHCHDDFKEDMLGKTMRVFYLLLLDRIMAVSCKVSEFFTIKGRISPKVITVYNGINTDDFNPQNISGDIKDELGLSEDTVVIGSIGVLEKDKGHKYLFESLAKLKIEGVTNIICIICGTGPEESHLKEFVLSKGLANEVLFLGFCNDIPKILKALDILVISSLTIESFSMVAVESMAMKVPVIATSVGGLPEVIDDGKTGILVPPGDVGALYGALEYLIENQQVRIQMGKKGRKRVLGKFTIEENVRKTEEVFLNVLKGD